MKHFKRIMASFAALAASAGIFAQDTTSTVIYDFSPWEDNGILKLFAEVADQGRKFPTQAEFEAAGIYIDGEFVRSHVGYRPILPQTEENEVVKGLFPTRRLWMNIPSGYGPTVGGFPGSTFNSDTYSLWNYTHIFGSWNHSINQAPGSWTDAAHKNGTYIYSGIKFFESWGTTSSSYNALITTKNPDGSFRYVDALLNALIYFGHDGINYNFEDNGYQKPDVVAFHRALYKRAQEIGFDSFHIGMYTANSYLTNKLTNYLLGDEGNGKICDVMLNYSANQIAYSRVPESLTAAKAAMGTAEDVYQGAWICTMDQYWTQMADENRKEMNLCLWGEHSISRFLMYAVGSTLLNVQENYQLLLEKAFSGGYRNPINRPAMRNSGHSFQVSGASEAGSQLAEFGGLATFIPERSAIDGPLPFNTCFSLGNGDAYMYRGRPSHGAWYNMSAQDYVPTYRWLVTQPGDMARPSTDIDVRFTHRDAWIGGSSLAVKGKTAASDLVLYRTNLSVNSSDVKAIVALKNGLRGSNASHVSLILRRKGSDDWTEIPCGNLASETWQELELPVNGLAQGDIIEYIGLRFKDTPDGYNMLIGQICVTDGSTRRGAAPIEERSLVAEVKEETATSISVKLAWNVDATGREAKFRDFGMVRNEEVGIDHFEIFYKDGREGRIREVARTASWCAFIGGVQLDAASDPWFGVRAVSADLKTATPTVWINVDRAQGDLPEGFNDLYDPSYLNEFSDNAATALETRFFAEVTTSGADKDIAYTRDEPVGGNNYVFERDYSIECHQGQTFDLTFRGADLNDNLKWCLIKGYIDWDINHDFDTVGDELLFEVGSPSAGTDAIVKPGVTIRVQVPEDAALGTSRLRIVASDAWFAHPGPYGGTTKGFSFDLPVVISGDNTPRTAALTHRDLRDKGEVEEPVQLEIVGIDSVIESDGIQPIAEMTPDGLVITGAEKAWIFDSEGRALKLILNPEGPISLDGMEKGLYLIRLQHGNLLRTHKLLI